MFHKPNYFWSSYFSLFFHYSSVIILTSHLSVPTPSIISMPFLPFNPLPCHYIIMTSYYIIWRHITSHYVIHLIFVIPKIYNNQPLLQYHMYPLSIPCNNMYPSFIPCNTDIIRKPVVVMREKDLILVGLTI